MDTLFFHPKLVHLPIALAALMPLIAGGLALAWWRKWLPARVWIVGVALQAVLVASGFAAMKTGEAEEEQVEEVVAEEHIEAHEEAAEVFVWTSVGVLALMLLALASPRGKLALAGLGCAGTLAAFILGYRTGDAGGALVYEHGAASAYATGGPTAAAPPNPRGGPDGDD